MTSNTSLGAALEAFILAHEYFGELDSGVEGDRVMDAVYVRGSDQPRRGSGLIASSALLVRLAAFG